MTQANSDAAESQQRKGFRNLYGLSGILKAPLSQRKLLIDIVVLMALWQLSTLFFPPIVAPSLLQIGQSILDIATDYSKFQHLLYTATRLVAGLILAFVIGSFLGLSMGVFNRVREYLKPLLHLIQGVPALSWVVFAVIWFPNVEMRILFILTIVTLPGFALYIDSAVRSVQADLLDLGRAFRANRFQQFRMIIIPAIIPEVLSAWSVNIGAGVRVVVVAELVGATTGVGFQLLNSQSIYDMSGAIAWTLMLVGFLMILQTVVSLAEAKLLAWRPQGEAA